MIEIIFWFFVGVAIGWYNDHLGYRRGYKKGLEDAHKQRLAELVGR